MKRKRKADKQSDKAFRGQQGLNVTKEEPISCVCFVNMVNGTLTKLGKGAAEIQRVDLFPAIFRKPVL